MTDKATLMDIWSILATNERFNHLIRQVRHISKCIWVNGWAEATAGNLSIDITGLLDPIPECGSRCWFLVSKTGSRYRDLACEPVSGLTIVSVDFSTDRDQFHPSDSRPTSEWITHRALQYRLIKSGLDGHVVLHAHPNPIILLSFLSEYGKTLDAKLTDILPEFMTILPEGIGYAPLCPPGSQELADQTINLMDSHQVIIWQKHGILAIANDLANALDKLEVAVKAVRIYLEMNRHTYHLT